MMEWFPIKTAPMSEELLVCEFRWNESGSRGFYAAGLYYNNGGESIICTIDNATHWSCLTEPVKEAKETISSDTKEQIEAFKEAMGD